MASVPSKRVRAREASRDVGAPERLYYRTDGPYRGHAPDFYDGDALAAARRVVESWKAIRAEYDDNVRRGSDGMKPVFNPAGPSVPGWRSVNLQTYLWRFRRARKSFPKTAAIIDSTPGLTSAFFNLLEPHSSIPPHEGDSNAIIRFHLGLDVPPGDCAVRAGSEVRRCATGEVLAFCDARNHASWNATDQPRLVLVFDVILPAYRRRMRWICANVLAATVVIWLEGRLNVLLGQSAEDLHKSGKTIPLPQWIRTLLRRSIGVAFHLLLPIQRRLS
ncbi:MAG TPA: aspartyl/asparaginyl beta-hydroxylase domain-containing protein [Candidatus Binatia bacterium]|nr:aspartyl/asparaginyl beta-hydroxylase domain-containing protein [Candidatus Binatia bacterium]